MATDRRNSFAAIPQLEAQLEKILKENVIFEKKVINIQEFQSDFYNEYGRYKELIAGKFSAVTADIVYLKTFEADIDNLYTEAVMTKDLSAEVAKLGYVEADTLNAKIAEFGYITAGSADLKYAAIGDFDAVKGRVGILEGSFSSFVSGEFGTLKSGVADIQTLIFGSATGSTITTEFANSVVSHIGDAQIHSGMIKELDFEKIKGLDIDTTKVTVHSQDGKSHWKDNTIQISDANRVRVQIGKDASNDYNMYVWDASGNLMFDALGLTASGIQREIIRNDMVAADAAIDGSKLNIQSVVSAIDGSTYTFSSSHLIYDGESLDLFLGRMSETTTEHGNTLSSQGTQIAAIQGQITSKIWQQDIDTAKGEMNTKYTTLEQSLGGFKSEVSSTYATKAENQTATDAAEEAKTIAEQTANKFTWVVKSGTNSTDFTLTDRVASLLSSEFQIDALTTFKNSAIDGTSTVINGGAIKTGTVDADRLNVTDLKAIGATIGGFTIGASAIYNGATSLAGADNSVYLGLDGISCGVSFKVDKAGNLSATSGKIAGFTIDNDKLSNAENPTSILDIGYTQEELKRWPGAMGNSYYLDYRGNMKVGIDNTGVGFYSLRRRGTPPVTISEIRSDYNLKNGEKTELVSSKVYAGLSGESVVFVVGENETMDSWLETWYSHSGFGIQRVEETAMGLAAAYGTLQAECNLNITGDVSAANLTRQKVTISGLPSGAGYTCYYYPVLKMCFLRLYYTGKAISATTTTVLGTVASGYRPSTQHALSIYPSQDTLKHRQAAISSDGGIKFYSEVAKDAADDTYITGFWFV